LGWGWRRLWWWQLGFGRRWRRGWRTRREKRETLEREREGEERERETLRLFFLNLNDYITSLFIVLRRLAS
jgi:hypothetical protein